MISIETGKMWSAAGLPWWKRWLLLTVFMIVMLLILVVTFIAVVFSVVVAAFSRLLPASWRRAPHERQGVEPLGGVECPWCNASIVIEPIVDGSQRGVCSGCGRHVERRYQSTALGEYWSPWQAMIGSENSSRQLTS